MIIHKCISKYRNNKKYLLLKKYSYFVSYKNEKIVVNQYSDYDHIICICTTEKHFKRKYCRSSAHRGSSYPLTSH